MFATPVKNEPIPGSSSGSSHSVSKPHTKDHEEKHTFSVSPITMAPLSAPHTSSRNRAVSDSVSDHESSGKSDIELSSGEFESPYSTAVSDDPNDLDSIRKMQRENAINHIMRRLCRQLEVKLASFPTRGSTRLPLPIWSEPGCRVEIELPGNATQTSSCSTSSYSTSSCSASSHGPMVHVRFFGESDGSSALSALDVLNDLGSFDSHYTDNAVVQNDTNLARPPIVQPAPINGGTPGHQGQIEQQSIQNSSVHPQIIVSPPLVNPFFGGNWPGPLGSSEWFNTGNAQPHMSRSVNSFNFDTEPLINSNPPISPAKPITPNQHPLAAPSRLPNLTPDTLDNNHRSDHDRRVRRHRKQRNTEGTASNNPTINTGRKFACPFFKRNPRKYATWTTCPGPGWEELHRVKEHLYRRHRLPIQCPRCWDRFDDDDLLRTHLQSEQACNMIPREEAPLLEGLTKTQMDRLRSRKKTRADVTPVRKWREIYWILFPDDVGLITPSPCKSQSAIFIADQRLCQRQH